jgi:hypothetical protein
LLRLSVCIAVLLAAASLAAPAAHATSTPDAADLAVCAFLAGTAQRQADAYLVKAAVFDLDGDGAAERLGIADEGTMHIDHYLVTKPDGSDTIAISEPVVEDDDWGWNMSQRWLIYSGRAYILRFAGYDTGYLRFVSRVGPDPVERPLCKFEPQTEIGLDPAKPADNDVCKAVTGHQVKYEAVERFPEPREAPGHDLIAGTASITGKLSIDFANGGKPTDAFLYEVDSSAGAGCSLKYFDTAAEDLTSPHHQLLTALQGLDLSDAYSRRTCADAEPRWFTFNGNHYLETESTAAETPTSERDEYRFVDVIDNGKPRHACEANYQHQPPKRAGVWDGANWAAPPAK